jgi:hypothetical protein
MNRKLIDVITDYVVKNYEENALLLSQNALMSIALATEILVKI